MGRRLQLSDTRAIAVPPVVAGVVQSVAVAVGTPLEAGTGRQRRATVLHNTVGGLVYLAFESHSLDQRLRAGVPPAEAFELPAALAVTFTIPPGQKLFAITTAAVAIRLSVHEWDELIDVEVD